MQLTSTALEKDFLPLVNQQNQRAPLPTYEKTHSTIGNAHTTPRDEPALPQRGQQAPSLAARNKLPKNPRGRGATPAARPVSYPDGKKEHRDTTHTHTQKIKFCRRYSSIGYLRSLHLRQEPKGKRASRKHTKSPGEWGKKVSPFGEGCAPVRWLKKMGHGLLLRPMRWASRDMGRERSQSKNTRYDFFTPSQDSLFSSQSS